MGPEHYAIILVALITLIGTIVSALGGVVAAIFARRASHHSREANRAVNHNAPGARRLYDLVEGSLKQSTENSAKIEDLAKRLLKSESRFEALYLFLNATPKLPLHDEKAEDLAESRTRESH